MLEESYYKLDLIPHLSEEIAAESIFYYLKNKLKFKFSFTLLLIPLST